jgi:hypothetical protein
VFKVKTTSRLDKRERQRKAKRARETYRDREGEPKFETGCKGKRETERHERREMAGQIVKGRKSESDTYTSKREREKLRISKMKSAFIPVQTA